MQVVDLYKDLVDSLSREQFSVVTRLEKSLGIQEAQVNSIPASVVVRCERLPMGCHSSFAYLLVTACQMECVEFWTHPHTKPTQILDPLKPTHTHSSLGKHTLEHSHAYTPTHKFVCTFLRAHTHTHTHTHFHLHMRVYLCLFR